MSGLPCAGVNFPKSTVRIKRRTLTLTIKPNENRSLGLRIKSIPADHLNEVFVKRVHQGSAAEVVRIRTTHQSPKYTSHTFTRRSHPCNAAWRWLARADTSMHTHTRTLLPKAGLKVGDVLRRAIGIGQDRSSSTELEPNQEAKEVRKLMAEFKGPFELVVDRHKLVVDRDKEAAPAPVSMSASRPAPAQAPARTHAQAGTHTHSLSSTKVQKTVIRVWLNTWWLGDLAKVQSNREHRRERDRDRERQIVTEVAN